MEQQYDVLIIGGGPAGSTMGRELQKSQLNVAIMDMADFPRDKICAGWVTPAVMDELELDLDDYAAKCTLQPIHGFRVGQLGSKLVKSSYEGAPISYGILRNEFDDYLIRRCGTELLLNQKFVSMEQNADGWLVNDSIQTRLVIGAGGHFCPVARKLSHKSEYADQKVVTAQEIEFEMTNDQLAHCKIDAEVPELFFLPDLEGYGWVFRKGNYLNIGLGREDNEKLSSHVKAFCQYLIKEGRVPADMPEKLHGHAYLLYPHAMREMVHDGVLLIGDAAGLAYPQSGEGIRPAIESAMLAAKVVKQCAGDYSANRLQAYNDEMAQRFGSRHLEPDLMDKLPMGLKKVMATYLMKSKWFTKNVVMDRWFLQNHQSTLVSQATSS